MAGHQYGNFSGQGSSAIHAGDNHYHGLIVNLDGQNLSVETLKLLLDSLNRPAIDAPETLKQKPADDTLSSLTQKGSLVAKSLIVATSPSWQKLPSKRAVSFTRATAQTNCNDVVYGTKPDPDQPFSPTLQIQHDEYPEQYVKEARVVRSRLKTSRHDARTASRDRSRLAGHYKETIGILAQPEPSSPLLDLSLLASALPTMIPSEIPIEHTPMSQAKIRRLQTSSIANDGHTKDAIDASDTRNQTSEEAETESQPSMSICLREVQLEHKIEGPNIQKHFTVTFDAPYCMERIVMSTRSGTRTYVQTQGHWRDVSTTQLVNCLTMQSVPDESLELKLYLHKPWVWTSEVHTREHRSKHKDEILYGFHGSLCAIKVPPSALRVDDLCIDRKLRFGLGQICLRTQVAHSPSYPVLELPLFPPEASTKGNEINICFGTFLKNLERHVDSSRRRITAFSTVNFPRFHAQYIQSVELRSGCLCVTYLRANRQWRRTGCSVNAQEFLGQQPGIVWGHSTIQICVILRKGWRWCQKTPSYIQAATWCEDREEGHAFVLTRTATAIDNLTMHVLPCNSTCCADSQISSLFSEPL
ncbi:hypothetical protein LTR64_005387 [Lithohypha guttulata]|uniref:uncharacterized protein n=1 Tax=Lithohypha guttulata TaxID=1690604 RepID=UPI002DDF2B43|nr:hypothetical protein LTR51_002819 [Lithohypha guttulata]